MRSVTDISNTDICVWVDFSCNKVTLCCEEVPGCVTNTEIFVSAHFVPSVLAFCSRYLTDVLLVIR